jgi:peptidoglycan/LPS O-acetylase OafA/YrhL
MRPTFGTAYDPARNNFDLLRLVLAGLVLWSHSYSLAGTSDPLRRLTGVLEGGRLGVEGFFVLSGFLVTQSWHRSTSAGTFAVKRALRVFPALVAAVVLSALVIGPFVTERSLAEYFAWSRPWLVFPGIVLHRFLAVPGAFPQNVFPGHVNASLWTLRYELFCYVMVAALGIVTARRRRPALLAVFAAAWLAALAQPDKGWFGGAEYWLPHLVSFFVAGMLFYELRELVPYSGWTALVAVIGLGAGAAAGRIDAALPIFGGYLVLAIAFAPGLPAAGVTRYGDLSYGLYVYAYPIQQLALHAAGGRLDPLAVLAVSLPATLLLAALSWRWIEEPALARKPRSAPASPPAYARTG